jgi:thioredoxin-like negative regulator of GroEL
MIGDWLKDDTSLTGVATFVNKVFLRHDFKGFQGDRKFEENFYARSMFAKERTAIAGLYAWRSDHSNDAAEKKRMDREADFAFRQAWALCPNSWEVFLRYVDFLANRSRVDDAILITRTCLPMYNRDETVSNFLANLEQYKKQWDEWANRSRRISTMENEAKVDPTDYTNIFSLAGYYLQVQQTNRATQLVEKTISQSDVPTDVTRRAAQFFADTRQFSELEIGLKKLTVTVPNEPEARYDLARVEAVLKKYDDAITDLQTAIRLSDLRLRTNSKAFDVRKAARTESAFEPIRNRPDFQKLVAP